MCGFTSHNNYLQKKLTNKSTKKLEFSTRVGTIVGRLMHYCSLGYLELVKKYCATVIFTLNMYTLCCFNQDHKFKLFNLKHAKQFINMYSNTFIHNYILVLINEITT